jgi:phage shock protein PspC (stress-responsive transcriptional regulator)
MTSTFTPPVAPPEQPAPPKPKRLTRSRTDRMIAGVCGGFAEYAGVDVNVVRLALVALSLFVGTGVVLYLIAWVLLPEGEY